VKVLLALTALLIGCVRGPKMKRAECISSGGHIAEVIGGKGDAWVCIK
jgi:hypothetical protein